MSEPSDDAAPDVIWFTVDRSRFFRIPDSAPLRISVDPACPCGTVLPFTLTGTYRVTGRDVLRLNVRGFATSQPLRGNFQEIQSTLRFEHKF